MNPMKVTAVALLLLGVIIAGYAAVSLSPGDTATYANPPTSSGPAMPSAMVLFPFAAVALAAGLCLWLFGGRGVIQTRNPAVRN
jgi:hypothetical protein